METVEIINLEPEEWARYRALRLEALRLEPQAFGASYADQAANPDDFWKERLQRVAVSDTEGLLFARIGQQLVGMIGWFREPSSPQAKLVAMYITQAARGRGIGSLLVHAALEDMSSHGDIEVVVLSVNRGQTAAVSLYEKHGFSVCSESALQMGDGMEHWTLEMEKRLHDADARAHSAR
jgi:ribosomal protein S18 acetylase RimI-like enzyme